MSIFTTKQRPIPATATPVPQANERRRSARAAEGAVAVIRRIVNGDPLNPVHCLIIDSNSGGLGLRAAIALVPDGIYRITTTDRPDDKGSLVKVVSARRRRDGSYDVGTRFVH